ncbi:MAG: hypothetical protein HY892_07880 [Deltaproteobacteria bacterium]|nr:hypothetical protein [Deltaproteobacteria bacterium]
MSHPLHEPVVQVVHQALALMDAYLRDRIDQPTYSGRIKALEVDPLLGGYREDFRHNPELVYYLDALMLLSSLQQELDFQVAEYGANVTAEDIRMLQELLQKFPA